MTGLPCVEDGAVVDGTIPADIPWLADGVPPIAAPVLACPASWRDVPAEAKGAPATCDPYPDGGALDCPAGQAHFPGEPSCVDVGSPCPTGDFSESLPVDRPVVYVQPGASGGDGSSEASPYASLTEFSIAGLPVATVIALSRGTHRGPVRLVRDVVLWGACTAETMLTTSEPSELDGVVTLRGDRGEVRDLTIADSPRPGVWLRGASTESRLEGVVVMGVEFVGVFVFDGARLMARTLAVRGTRARARDGDFGRGLEVGRSSTGEVTRALFEGNRDAGIVGAQPDTTLSLADVVVRDTQSQLNDGSGGRGLGLEAGAAADVTRALFEANRELGAYAGDSGTMLTLADVVVRDTQGQDDDGAAGGGVDIEGGATGEVARVLFQRNREVDVFAGHAGTTVTLTDVVCRDTQGQRSDGMFGRAINVEDGAAVDVARARFERNRDTAAYVGDAGTRVTLTDVVIRDVQSQQTNGVFGRAVNVSGGATTDASRALFEQARDIGVYARGAGTTITMADVVVRDIDSQSRDGLNGHGAGCYGQAALSMTRFVVERAELCGVHLAADGQVDFAEGEVREHAIGVCLQVDGYDLGRLTDGVRFTDNDINLQSSSLPVPEPAAPLAPRSRASE